MALVVPWFGFKLSGVQNEESQLQFDEAKTCFSPSSNSKKAYGSFLRDSNIIPTVNAIT